MRLYSETKTLIVHCEEYKCPLGIEIEPSTARGSLVLGGKKVYKIGSRQPPFKALAPAEKVSVPAAKKA